MESTQKQYHLTFPCLISNEATELRSDVALAADS